MQQAPLRPVPQGTAPPVSNTQLQEWEAAQARTFSKWVQNQLSQKYGPQAPVVTNIFTDLSDGVVLMMLFEALFGSRGLKRPANYNMHPTTRIQKLDNVTSALKLLPAVGITTVFLGAANVVDGDRKMILGLIWRLILATQIVALGKQVETLGGDERKINVAAKQALLDWVRNRLAPYPNVKVDNFNTSWSSGMAFLALVHSQNPVFDFAQMDPTRADDNLELAFHFAADMFGIPKLLEVGDMQHPDEHCVMTYVSEFAFKFDILKKTDQMRLLTEKEQELAMQKAESERKLAAEQAAQKEKLDRQLRELRDREAQLAAGHMQLSETEARMKAELERAIHMQEEAEAKMLAASRFQSEAAEQAQRQAAQLEAQRAQAEADRARLAQQQAAHAEQTRREQEELQRQKQAMEQESGARRAQLNAEYEAKQRQLAAEEARRQQEIAAQTRQLSEQMERMRMQTQATQQEAAALAADRERFARERAEYEQRKQAEEEAHRKRAEELEVAKRSLDVQAQARVQQEAIEKKFADHANGIDAFIVEEQRKIDSCSNLSALEPIEKFGVPRGEEMLNELRGVADEAMRAGLGHNRFTQHTLKSLEDRWSSLKAALQAATRRLTQSPPSYLMGAQGGPMPQYPSPPQSQYPPAQSQYASPPGLGPPPAPSPYGGGYPPQSMPPQSPGLGMPYNSQYPQQPQYPPASPGLGVYPQPQMQYAQPVYAPGLGYPVPSAAPQYVGYGVTQGMQCPYCLTVVEVPMMGPRICPSCFQPL